MHHDGNVTCPTCDTPALDGDPRCGSCGAALTCGACGGRLGADGYCQACGRHQWPDHVEVDLGAAGAAISDRGRRHRRNEDAAALRRVPGARAVVGVVCDGVSSASRPDDAAHTAAEVAAAALVEALLAGADPVAASTDAASAASTAVVDLGTGHGDDPACTYVSAVVTDGAVAVGWLGDSRAYWLAGDDTGQALTEDDSWGAQMVARGAITAEEAAANRLANALTGWLGADAPGQPVHVATYTPAGPGAVLVCTDGLWNYLSDPAALAAVALPRLTTTPIDAARALVDHALDAGGHDNITVILVPYPVPDSQP